MNYIESNTATTKAEVAVLKHIRGELHYSPDCAWCRDIKYFSAQTIEARRALNSVITGE